MYAPGTRVMLLVTSVDDDITPTAGATRGTSGHPGHSDNEGIRAHREHADADPTVNQADRPPWITSDHMAALERIAQLEQALRWAEREVRYDRYRR